MNYRAPDGYVLAVASAKTVFLRPEVSYCLRGKNDEDHYHPMPEVYIKTEPIDYASFYDENMYKEIFGDVRSTWSLCDQAAFQTVYDRQNPFSRTYLKTMGVPGPCFYGPTAFSGMFQLAGPRHKVRSLNPMRTVRDYWDVDLEDPNQMEPGRSIYTRIKETSPDLCCWRDAEADPKIYGGTYGCVYSIRHLIVDENRYRHVWCGRFPMRSITVRRFDSHEHFERSVHDYFAMKNEEEDDF